MHARTRDTRPLLAAVARAKCACDGGRMLTIGGPVLDPRDAHVADTARTHHDVDAWARSIGAAVIVGWGGPVASIIARQALPAFQVLDGLPDQADAAAAVQWLGDCLTPTVVMSPDLAQWLDVHTQGRACTTVMPPPVQGVVPVEAPLNDDHVHVVAEPWSAHLMRPVLDLCVRQRLVGRSWIVTGDRRAADADLAASMVDAAGMTMRLDDEGPPPAWAVAGQVRGARPSCAPVLPAAAAWVRGATVMLPTGHAAEGVLGAHGGVVLNVDGDQSASARQLQAITATGDRAAIAEAWCQEAGACLDALAESICSNSESAAPV